MENLKSGTNSVKFKSQGVMLAGNLHLPKDFDPNKKYSAVIFSPPFNQVKEQMGDVYGKKMAENGYIFLAFDHLGYGESEGKPRNSEHPYIKMENLRNSISYLRTLPFVDREHFYGIGACAGGGYLPMVAVTDKRMKAIATVSGLLNNAKRFLDGMTVEQRAQAFAFTNEQRQKIYETGETTYFDGMGFDKVDPNNTEDLPLLTKDGYDYYMTKRAGVPNFDPKTPTTLLEVPPLINAEAYAPYLNTPYLGIYGERAMNDNGPLTVAFYEACTEPKKLHEVKGASHVDLYDKEEFVNEAIEQIVEFFGKY